MSLGEKSVRSTSVFDDLASMFFCTLSLQGRVNNERVPLHVRMQNAWVALASEQSGFLLQILLSPSLKGHEQGSWRANNHSRRNLRLRLMFY
jgi:hypothetical protein